MKRAGLSPMECRVLSELLTDADGVSPTDLARRARMSRPSLYVLLRRLAKARRVSRPPAVAPRGGSHAVLVLYAITAAGRAARARYAAELGLRT